MVSVKSVVMTVLLVQIVGEPEDSVFKVNRKIVLVGVHYRTN